MGVFGCPGCPGCQAKKPHFMGIFDSPDISDNQNEMKMKMDMGGSVSTVDQNGWIKLEHCSVPAFWRQNAFVEDELQASSLPTTLDD
jgi:hypothetical protein